MKTILLFLLILTNFTVELSGQQDSIITGGIKKLNFEEVKKMVNNRLFVFIPSEVVQQGDPNLILKDYSSEVLVENNKVVAFIRINFSEYNEMKQYFTRNYLNVEGNLNHVIIEENQNRNIVTMSFSVINEGYISLRDKGKFIFDFTFFDNGKTILILTRPGDRRITYIGKSQMIVTGIE